MEKLRAHGGRWLDSGGGKEKNDHTCEEAEKDTEYEEKEKENGGAGTGSKAKSSKAETGEGRKENKH